MSNVSSRTVHKAWHEVFVPIRNGFLLNRQDMYDALAAADRKYRELHLMKPGQALSDTSYEVYVTEEEIGLRFVMESKERPQPVYGKNMTDLQNLRAQMEAVRLWINSTQYGKASAELATALLMVPQS